MSWIDDFKNLFSFHAEQLDKRMGAMEDHLSNIALNNDATAREIDYETKRVPLNNVTNESSQVLVVPAGSFYELVHWAWENMEAEEVTPTIYVNGVVIDCPPLKRKCGASNPNELVFMENDTVTVKLTEGTKATAVQFMFKAYEVAPERQTITGSGG